MTSRIAEKERPSCCLAAFTRHNVNGARLPRPVNMTGAYREAAAKLLFDLVAHVVSLHFGGVVVVLRRGVDHSGRS